MQTNKKGIQKLAYSYLYNKVANNTIATDPPFIINETELKQIKKIKFNTIFWASIIGCAGVLIYYLPIYYLESKWQLGSINLFSISLKWIDIISTIYGIILIWPELWLLNLINVKAVKNLANACNYPNKTTQNLAQTIDKLTDVGMENPSNELKNLAINPYLGMNKFYFWFITLLTRFKATISNILVKIILKRLLGRFALKAITDLAGMPVFAFWNAWASYQVLKEAKLRIMLPSAINHYLLQHFPNSNTTFLEINTNQLTQYLAQLKRKYNYAHYLFSTQISAYFNLKNIETQPKTINLSDFKLKTPAEIQVFTHLVALGMCVDGQLNNKEKNAIKNLIKEGKYNFSLNQTAAMASNFANGKGFIF